MDQFLSDDEDAGMVTCGSKRGIDRVDSGLALDGMLACSHSILSEKAGLSQRNTLARRSKSTWRNGGRVNQVSGCC
jgi:hypothetical protein